MDIISHALLPYLLGSFFRMNKKQIAAFVLGGIAPDLDFLVVWVNYFYPTSFLIVHRGFTHTFLFGFFTVLIILYLASRISIKSSIQRFVDFDLDFSFSSIAIAFVGLMTHLFLDFLTTRGVPLFYPWDYVRYSADIFFQTELIIMIASLVVLVKIFREKRSKDRSWTRINKKYLIIFLAFLIVVGAARIDGKETTQSFFANENARVYPDSGLFQWVVLEDDIDQFHVYEFNSLLGKIEHSSAFFRMSVPFGVEAPWKAIDAAEKLSQVKLFRWRAYAVAINVTFQNGSWYLEYFDPIVKTEMMNAWLISQMDIKRYGSIQIKVDGERAAVI
jgi:inner membrane protein